MQYCLPKVRMNLIRWNGSVSMYSFIVFTNSQVLKMKNKKTSMSDGVTMDHSIWRNLPPEIIENVLSRLPIKFLCRFKCVSPSWNSLISSTRFAKTCVHTSNDTNTPQKSLLISSFDALYSVDFAAANPTAEKLDFTLSVRDSTNRVCGWGSCNGLVLVSDEGFNYNLFLLNPFTRECKELPDSPLIDFCYSDNVDLVVNGFGYDSSTDDYKVVMLLSRSSINSDGITCYINSVAVYSLKTDAWRRIQDTPYNPEGNPAPGVYFNERIHWLCRTTSGSKVVAFDLWDEIFREVPLPTSFDNHRLGYLFWAVLGSCLCLVVSPYKDGEIEVWTMKKYGVRESWTKFTIANHGMWMSLLDVLYLAAEEEFVFRTIVVPDYYREKLIVYNPKNETLRDRVVCGIPMIYTVVGNYIETLVSPNHGG